MATNRRKFIKSVVGFSTLGIAMLSGLFKRDLVFARTKAPLVTAGFFPSHGKIGNDFYVDFVKREISHPGDGITIYDHIEFYSFMQSLFDSTIFQSYPIPVWFAVNTRTVWMINDWKIIDGADGWLRSGHAFLAQHKRTTLRHEKLPGFVAFDKSKMDIIVGTEDPILRYRTGQGMTMFKDKDGKKQLVNIIPTKDNL